MQKKQDINQNTLQKIEGTGCPSNHMYFRDDNEHLQLEELHLITFHAHFSLLQLSTPYEEEARNQGRYL